MRLYNCTRQRSKRSIVLGDIMTIMATVVVALAILSGQHSIVSAFQASYQYAPLTVLPSTSTATFLSLVQHRSPPPQLLLPGLWKSRRCKSARSLPTSLFAHQQPSKETFDDDDTDTLHLSSASNYDATVAKVLVPSVGLVTSLLIATFAVFPEAAMAATSTSSSPLLNALVAYGHYACLLLITALLTFERMTVKADMSVDTEKSLVLADALYGLTAVALFYTGYLRATDFGKGWDFYAHEPFFWLKLANAGVLGGLSLFPTIIFIQRGRNLFNDTDSTSALEPMSEALATRLRKVLNAELSAMATLPLFATLMARGVGYADWLPWQAGAAFTATALIGSSVYYAKQALTWKEDDNSSNMSD